MKIAESLRSLVVPIDSVREDPENARIHPIRNLETITRSLERFGQRKPIVIRDGIIIAGNGTHRQAKALGATEIAVVDVNDLTPAEAKAFGLVDNKSSDLAEWDWEQLGKTFQDLDADLIAVTGFADFEIEQLPNADWTPPQNYNLNQSAGDSGDGHDVLHGLSPIQRRTIMASIAIARKLHDGMTMSAALVHVCQTYIDAHTPTDDASAAAAPAAS